MSDCAEVGLNDRDIESRLRLAVDVLTRLNRPGETRTLIADVLRMIVEHTGFDAAGIRLRQDDDYPYYEVRGFSKEFIEHENFLCDRDGASGASCTGATAGTNHYGVPLACMCGRVIRGEIDSGAASFTPGGSFWTSSTTDLLGALPPAEREKFRGYCNRSGYETVALIPLDADSARVGLLQLNDRRRDRLDQQAVEFFEGLGASIGIALARQSAEESRLLAGRLQGAIEAAGAACHEMNQPLQALTGYAEVLLAGMPVGAPGREVTQAMLKQATRMAEITGKLARITRYEVREYLKGSRIIDLDRAAVQGDKP
jgi:hypothetical protein